MTTTERGLHIDTGSPTGDNGAVTALDDVRPNEAVEYRSAPSGVDRKTALMSTMSDRDGRVTAGDRSCERPGRPHGIEVRVHGIGDHSTFSALGRPNYKELVDSRVWIGQVPQLPAHPLRLVNWSRANRKITRHLGWYLAFPFTLINVAGYMEPTDKSRHILRAGVGLASLCLTVSMAAWLTVIFETAWRTLAEGDDRLTGVLLQVAGPGILIVFTVYRMLAGRALVDKADATMSVATIAALAGMIAYLHSKPAMGTGGWLHRAPSSPDGASNAVDPMLSIVIASTVIVFVVALCLCGCAWATKTDRAALAGAALLLVFAVTLLHAAGSILRLFTDSVVRFVPANHGPPVHVAPGSAMDNVLLPKSDDLSRQIVARVAHALRIDLIPVFFLAMLAVFAIVFWIELSKQRKRSSVAHQPYAAVRSTKSASYIHELVVALPCRFATPVAFAIAGTVVLWVLMCLAYHKFLMAHPWQLADLVVTLQVLGAFAVVMIVMRRPEQFADRLRSIFGSIADIAGFWAPDLHPLAGASYRRALLSGIRQTINDLVLEYPNDPIALVGHSQGCGVCLVRSRVPLDRATDGRTDRSPRAQGEHASAHQQRTVGSNRVVHLRLTVVHAVPDLLSPLFRCRVLRKDVENDLQESFMAQPLAQDRPDRFGSAHQARD